VTKFCCAQRGCAFEVPEIVTPATLADDGVTVIEPARVDAGPAPELCPGCGHPFVPHPAPETL
jgi:hypothetical protein